ncbi:C-N hydrolase family amidase [Halolamina pelagica]|uniref:C-N hydrolase family amidase n=1 Tax=Halolamina pelagica TaxID=699431 RepID=A0A0P7HCP0_9EURY|nr:carbon-nitrogen family hydrolase [Halolamina pelagica]KPN31310.1 C-N hydrolase family amidase [Halolamina pelagica]
MTEPIGHDDAITVALAQHRIEAGRLDRNVDRAIAAIERAAAEGADLVCLPEMFNVGYFAFDAYARNAEPIDGPTLGRIADAAADHGVAVQAGSFVEDLAASAEAGFDTPEPDGLANASVFLDRAGEVQGVYRKQHLFGYDSAETQLLTPGESLPTVEFEGFTVGMTTCYDLRFPELYRQLADEGVSLVLVPSAWPYPRVEHWRTLPRSRAIENLAYVAAVNGAGEMGDDELVGRSTVYDPWGTPIATCDDDPELVTADLSPGQVDDVREEFPALRDRRL